MHSYPSIFVKRLFSSTTTLYLLTTLLIHQKIDYFQLSPSFRFWSYLQYSILILLEHCLRLLARCAHMLYTDFSASRQIGLLVFPRFDISTTCIILTRIQPFLFKIASITPTIRSLPLVANKEALHLFVEFPTLPYYPRE